MIHTCRKQKRKEGGGYYILYSVYVLFWKFFFHCAECWKVFLAECQERWNTTTTKIRNFHRGASQRKRRALVCYARYRIWMLEESPQKSQKTWASNRYKRVTYRKKHRQSQTSQGVSSTSKRNFSFILFCFFLNFRGILDSIPPPKKKK